MGKLNSKGFVMAETLVAAVFVMTMLTILYVHFYPLVGEYEKREVYDDVDSKYGAFWIKRFIQHESYILTDGDRSAINNNGYILFSCSKINDQYRQNVCKELLKQEEVYKDHIYITNYIIGIGLSMDDSHTDGSGINYFKNVVDADKDNDKFTGGLADYVYSLPNYSHKNGFSFNEANYRVIVEYHRKKGENDFYSYSTIEVKK